MRRLTCPKDDLRFAKRRLRGFPPTNSTISLSANRRLRSSVVCMPIKAAIFKRSPFPSTRLGASGTPSAHTPMHTVFRLWGICRSTCRRTALTLRPTPRLSFWTPKGAPRVLRECRPIIFQPTGKSGGIPSTATMPCRRTVIASFAIASFFSGVALIPCASIIFAGMLPTILSPQARARERGGGRKALLIRFLRRFRILSKTTSW